MPRPFRSFSATVSLVAFAVTAYTARPVRTGTACSSEQQTVQPFLERASALCQRAVPGVRDLQFTATRLVAYRPGCIDEPVWSVQISDAGGKYIGETSWDICTRELVDAHWRVDEPSRRTTTPIRLSEAAELARLWVARIDRYGTSMGWEIRRSREKTESAWIFLARGPSTRLRLKLGLVTGRLIALERRSS